jgi:hypothetical protein
VLYSRARANLNGRNLTRKLRDLLWAECTVMSTMQENILVTNKKKISSREQFYGNELPGWRFMRQFEEIGIVNYGSSNKMKPKHLNCGRACLCLGCALNQPKDTFHFLNLDTMKVILSQDVLWMDAI